MNPNWVKDAYERWIQGEDIDMEEVIILTTTKKKNKKIKKKIKNHN
jgi:hypothetical protein